MQSLIILTILGVWGGLAILKITKINFVIITIIFIVYFLFSLGFISQIIGSPTSINLNNFGGSYDDYYIHLTELSSSNYFSMVCNKNCVLYVDYAALLRFKTIKENTIIIKDIFPSIISKDSYVYASETNYRFDRTINPIKKGDLSISFNFPTEFLNENKNKIYNNGGSEIFK